MPGSEEFLEIEVVPSGVIRSPGSFCGSLGPILVELSLEEHFAVLSPKAVDPARFQSPCELVLVSLVLRHLI